MRVSTIFLLLLFPWLLSAEQEVISSVLPLKERYETDRSFKWRPALEQSMRMLFVQHGFRLAVQPGTRQRLRGKFFADYAESVKATKGWGDSDNFVINYINHPIQGGVGSYVYLQNDPKSRGVEFGNTPEYWKSRLRALAWNAALSTQFEIGPFSEASIGNVGQRKGTSGYVDFVVTPVGGFALLIAEDWLDKRFIQRWEAKTNSIGKRTFLRIALNPSRSLANLLQLKGPWHRDGRALLGSTGY